MRLLSRNLEQNKKSNIISSLYIKVQNFGKSGNLDLTGGGDFVFFQMFIQTRTRYPGYAAGLSGIICGVCHQRLKILSFGIFQKIPQIGNFSRRKASSAVVILGGGFATQRGPGNLDPDMVRQMSGKQNMFIFGC